MNQFNHPYQGSIYYGFARSAGLNYWESFLYTNAGSFLWETYGENTPPSTNDQIASGIAGSFFGERSSGWPAWLLEAMAIKPGFWRELGATVLTTHGDQPLAFGDRFKPCIPDQKSGLLLAPAAPA
jgi:hypothetical protein